MNDSSNTDGVSGTPESNREAQERETSTSASPESGAATEAASDRHETTEYGTSEIRQASDGRSQDEQPTTEIHAAADAPTAHVLPHRTGPTPAHYVNAADDTYQPYQQAYQQQQPQPYGQQQQPGYYGQPRNGYYNPQDPGQAYGAYAQAPSGSQPPYNGQQPYGYGQVPPAFAQPKRRPKRWTLITGAAVVGVIIAGAAGGGAYALGHATGEQAANAAGQNQTLQLPNGSSGSGSSGSGSSGTFGGGTGTFGGGTGTQGGSGSSSGTGTVPSDATAATATEKQGLVTIVSTLDYDESSKSAGTGMIMTANGEILTNNHVVQGATSIQVTVVSTGKTYTADVVGTDATHDVAVLKLQGASGLTPVSFGKNATVKSGDSVHSTGNAEGTGSLVTAKGTVTATKQSITVQSESGSGTESLSNLIEISADVVSGDSGGPLRNADGKVVGIVTAASSGTTDVTGYAIPISGALSIADDILAGKSSQYITIGLPAFLGAQISSAGTGTGTGTTTSGVTIAGTVTGSAAAKAGLVAGDTITAIGGTAVADSTALTDAIQSHKVGDSVTVTYVDTAGASHTVTVTLGSGPAA
jgi:S1-C subfamily serine protease